MIAMAVKYVGIDGEQVSLEWYAVLRDMRADGVRFNVNEGHRTMARQAYFYALYRSGRGPIAAVPSPYAPHIRTGRIDHAIDFSNDPAVFAWLQKNGLDPHRTVRWPNGTVREPWHIEVTAARLKAYAAKHHVTSEPTLKQGQTGPSIVRLKKLLYAKGYRNFSGKNNSNRYNPFFSKYTASAVKRFQKAHHLTADGQVGAKTWAALHK